jgi:hypothetical protein
MEVAVGQTAPRVFTLVRGSAPIEHPYAFAGPLGRPSLVFSWEKYGNFDAFLLSLPPTGTHPVVERRLTVAQSYSFNPQAVTDSRGHVDVLHYESCCAQQNFKIEWNRFDASGRSIAPTKVLGVVQERGVNTLQWGEALGRDGAGDIWGAFTLDSGVGLLHARPDGTLVGPAESLDPVPEQPQSVALALGPSGGYGFWEENNGIGTNLESRHFDATSAGDIERIEYISGQQHNVHAAFFGSQYRVLWQTITPSGAYVFQTNEHRKAAGPDLAERLGLGLGNPWEAAALLFGGALGLGILAAVINVVDAIVLTLLGMLLLRVLRSVAGRWVIVTLLLTGIFFAMFVSPGLPVIFLTTLPGLGFDGAQFVVPAIAGALLFVGLLSQTGLRRIDDIYRLGAMAFVGIFFFGFIEAALFVQQELGYI